MGKEREPKIEKEEEDLEMNEELQEIDEILENTKYVDNNIYANKEPKSIEEIIGKEAKEYWRLQHFDVENAYEKEEVREKLLMVYRGLPRAITNNELPEPFYSFKKTRGLLSEVFSRLELMEVDDYNKKMARFLERRPGLICFSGSFPYRINYDGKNIFKKEVFLDYSVKEKGKIMEANEDLVLFGKNIIHSMQSTRLDYLRKKDHGTLMADQGIKIVRYMEENKKYLSEELAKEASNVYEEFCWARGDDIDDNRERREVLKKRFQDEHAFNEECSRLEKRMLELGQEAITEIKRKMKENYEAKKESK